MSLSTAPNESASLAAVLRGCLGAGIAFVAPAARAITLSPDAAELLGIAGAPGNQPAWEAVPAPLRDLATEALVAGAGPLRRRITVPTPAGGAMTLEVDALPVAPAGTGVLLHLADVALLRQCEERLQRLDRLANLGTLAATMAHEIKNALVAGRTFVDLLLEKNPQAELTEVVRRELTRMDAIVARLLKFARPASARFTAVHAHDLLEHALRLLQPQLENRNIVLERQLRATTDLVTADEDELLQAFMNLLLNAVEALAPDGKLTVGTGNVSRDGSGVAELRVTISDNGVGIPAENVSHLFDPFFTTKPSGTGLGLAVTKRIIEEHHGALTVESRAGQGTSFSVALPLAAPSAHGR